MKCHLYRKDFVHTACNKPGSLHTTDYRRVTCKNCKRTVHFQKLEANNSLVEVV